MKPILLFFAFTALCSYIFGQNLKRIDSLLNTKHHDGFNGNVLYFRNDSIIYSGNFGVTNYSTNQPLNDSSIFELGSVSKQFTALATVQLIERGKIQFDTKVEEIIPTFPYTGITVEQLLRHQSGLPSFMMLMKKKKVWNREKIANNYDVLDALIKFKPKVNFQPGTKYDYSNTGYVTLAMIIEKVSGMTFPEYLTKNIFEPAGMNHSAVIRRRYAPVNIPNNTEGYRYNRKRKVYEIKNMHKDNFSGYLDGVMGDGSISSSTLDMVKWNRALQNHTLLSSENTERMFTNDEISKDYGLGFFIDEDEEQRNIYHGGSWAGYYAWAYYIPETNEYIVVLCNNNYGKTRSVLTTVLNNI